MVVIDPDKDLLLAGSRKMDKAAWLTARISSIPIAMWMPRYCNPFSDWLDRCNILTLGTLSYPPNADGIRWFMQEIFPLVQQEVPDVTLTVIGKNPTGRFCANG